ncbi:uncharacterized protein [Henckelia pumila]|uniref:uncharacterized protein n=1 Tax=Henckelia pumila TaxID=405737 RepID=UPI003C6E6296
MLHECGAVTWEKFRAAFLKLYFPPALHQDKSIELLNLKQGSLTVDKYYQKFFELLPFFLHINVSSEAKYNKFLLVLNIDIFNRGSVCNDPTPYEWFVNRCRQAENSLQHNRFIQSSRPTSTLGPKTQSFNKSSTSFSSSSSGDFFCFSITEAIVIVDGEHQFETSCSGAGVSLSQDHANEDKERVISSIFLLCGILAFFLIDMGASHSFITARFVKRHRLSYVSLDVVLSISTPIGYSALDKRLVMGCSLEFEAFDLTANLMILAMEDFDCIVGIDLFTSYRATVDRYHKIVQFHPAKGNSWFFYGEGA